MNKPFSEVKIGDIATDCGLEKGKVVGIGTASEMCEAFRPQDIDLFEYNEDCEAIAVNYAEGNRNTYIWGYDFDGSLGGSAVVLA